MFRVCPDSQDQEQCQHTCATCALCWVVSQEGPDQGISWWSGGVRAALSMEGISTGSSSFLSGQTVTPVPLFLKDNTLAVYPFRAEASRACVHGRVARIQVSPGQLFSTLDFWKVGLHPNIFALRVLSSF